MDSRWSAIIAATTFVLALSACAGDPKKPSDENFTRAIDVSLKKKVEDGTLGGSACVRDINFPKRFDADRRHWTRDREVEPTYAAYVRAGLAMERTVPARRGVFDAIMPEAKAVHEYALSRSGEANAISHPGYPDYYSFCYASYQVGKIVNFTEPGDELGTHVSHVVWVPKVVAVADWVKSDRATNAVPDIKKGIADLTATEKSSKLVLTSTGWEVAP